MMFGVLNCNVILDMKEIGFQLKMFFSKNIFHKVTLYQYKYSMMAIYIYMETCYPPKGKENRIIKPLSCHHLLHFTFLHFPFILLSRLLFQKIREIAFSLSLTQIGTVWSRFLKWVKLCMDPRWLLQQKKMLEQRRGLFLYISFSVALIIVIALAHACMMSKTWTVCALFLLS